MSPRSRTVSDDAIPAVMARVISRVGPAGMTPADVGAEVGLAPATLVQRFGSKRGLLLAVVKFSIDSGDQRFALVRERAKTALDALFTAASDMAEHVRTPEALVHNLAFFQIDLSDPDFHRLTLDHSRRVRAGYMTLLDEAVRAGELDDCDTEALAIVLQAAAAGVGAELGDSSGRDGPAVGSLGPRDCARAVPARRQVGQAEALGLTTDVLTTDDSATANRRLTTSRSGPEAQPIPI